MDANSSLSCVAWVGSGEATKFTVRAGRIPARRVVGVVCYPCVNEFRFIYVGNSQWGQFLRLSTSLLRWEWGEPSRILEDLLGPSNLVPFNDLGALRGEIGRGSQAVSYIKAQGWAANMDGSRRRTLDLLGTSSLYGKMAEPISAEAVFYPVLSVLSDLTTAAEQRKAGVLFINTGSPLTYQNQAAL